ncbi:MAG TPA: TRC40/GET3/ArsA family transport-energizing ATPase [Longimicrobiaceae bacterium]|nr:TRC40/GET3/ArsA family transport-energizing ATPase [Longimicrobiaceae bacterium]
MGERWTFVGGKGGVGKTTVAAALGIELADAGDEVLVVSTDPAHSLGDVLSQELTGEPTPVADVPRLQALEVDAERERRHFLDLHREDLLTIIERGTYLENDDIGGFLDLALPGMDELAALLQLLRLTGTDSSRTIIDTAPTGHTLRLLELPRVLSRWLRALEAMEDKHQGVATALAGAYRPDSASVFLTDLSADLDRFQALLTDPQHTRFILVTTPDPAVLAETRRYRKALNGLDVPLAGILVNRSAADPENMNGSRVAYAPVLVSDPRGVDGLRRYARNVGSSPTIERGEASAEAAHTIALGDRLLPPTGRDIYAVAGKGGVGKTTSAAALALLLARRDDENILLLSTDPAGSLGDVLGVAVGPDIGSLPGQPNLNVQQIDANAVWDGFRDEYREAAETLFQELLGSSLSADADLAVISRLIDLAPPGLDEVMALLEVVDLMEDRAYNALVLDTAPTGHFLRLLEMPAVALDWSHAMLRLLLKYREVMGLGDLAERVLRLSRALRSLQALLTDPEKSWVLVVSLPESLSVPETSRLTTALLSLGITPGALLVNRVHTRGSAVVDTNGYVSQLVSAAGEIVVAGAPDLNVQPMGTDALMEFGESWRKFSAQ